MKQIGDTPKKRGYPMNQCDEDCKSCMYYLESMDIDLWPWSCMKEILKMNRDEEN